MPTNKKKKNRITPQSKRPFTTVNLNDVASSGQLSQGTTVTPEVVTEKVPEQTVTLDDVKASKSESEFNAKKEQYFTALIDDAAFYEDEKKSAEEAYEKAKASLDTINASIEEIQHQKESIQKLLDDIRGQCDEAMEKLQHAQIEEEEARQRAADVTDAAEAEAKGIRESASRERINILASAAEDARGVWQTEADKLTEQLKDLAERESKLQAEKRDVEKAQRNIEDEKEAINDLKADLAKRKERYDAANPAMIVTLETELGDVQKRYDALMERYQATTKKLAELQALMDTMKTEIEDSVRGKVIVSMNEIVTALHELKEKHEKLLSIYERYPNDAAIAALEEKVKYTDALERDNEALVQERNKYRDESVAARNDKGELEAHKREIEATKALNDHLLKELESHKTALESRTGDTCPSLSKVDTETESDDFMDDIAKRTQRTPIESLKELVEHVKNYAGSRREGEQLYYTPNDIRAFLSGMAVSRLTILQGMSGTGKSSLPRIFAEAISGFNRLIPVESSWRDRNELLGYYNDFNKKFNAKSFTIELYRCGKDRCANVPTFIVLDEMNLARIEYYFSDFLAILQEPNRSKWLIELVSSDMRTLPMELPDNVKQQMQKESPKLFDIWSRIERSHQGDLKSETSDDDKEELYAYLDKLGRLTGAKSLIDGRKIKVTDNIWFVGTANRDESTFEISDKVYDRAQVVSLNKKGVSDGNYLNTSAKYISVTALDALFKTAKSSGSKRREVEERLMELDDFMVEKFDTSFGNRIVAQTIDFVAVFVAAGGSVNDALDYQISSKILRKVIASDDEEALLELENKTKDYPETQRLIRKRLKELK